MSFGDISSNLQLPSDTRTLPVVLELQRLLKPLSANNAVLRNTTELLLSNDPAKKPDLKRIRALREQNKQIARAAADMVATVDVQVAGQLPDVISKARQARNQFQQLIDDFSQALSQSMQAEQTYLRAMLGAQQNADAAPANKLLNESQIAVGEEIASHAPTESDPLLPASKQVYSREQALLREIQDNDTFAKERGQVLTDVQSSIEDVNAIFKDLAHMVNDQRSQTDHIEVNIRDSVENVSGATRELGKTQKRRESRKRFFFSLLLAIAAVLAVLIILIVN